jgi:hypothetical protein
MARQTGELTDAQWAALRPLPPPQRPATGRPNKDHRLILEAIIWLDRTDAPWRDLPCQYGPWKTVASRFYRWRRQGVSTTCSPRPGGPPTLLASSTGWCSRYGTIVVEDLDIAAVGRGWEGVRSGAVSTKQGVELPPRCRSWATTAGRLTCRRGRARPRKTTGGGGGL